MALTHSPKVVTDGLVFYYDMANTKKSWKGAPTVNIMSQSGLDCALERSGTSYPFVSSNISTYVLANWSAGNNKLSMQFEGKRDYVGGGTGGGLDGYPVMYIYFSDWTWASSFGISSYDWSYNKIENITMPDPTGKAIYFAVYHMNSTNRGKSYSRNHQIEFGTFATPFVNGTRPSSLYNLVTGQTPTVQTWNLTYSSNGTFSFSGSGASSRVSMGDFSIGSWPLAYGVSPNNYTVEVIFKPSSVSNYQNVFDGSGSGNYGPRLEMNSSGNLVWVIGNSVGAGSQYTAYTVVSSGLQSNVYHHVILTVANNTVKTYYNSSLVTSTALVYANDGNSLEFPILGRGFSTSAERWFVGEIPMFRVYNRSISDSEVKQNFNAQRGRYGL